MVGCSLLSFSLQNLNIAVAVFGCTSGPSYYDNFWCFGTSNLFVHWVSNHPNWPIHIFQRGGSTTNQISKYHLRCEAASWGRRNLCQQSDRLRFRLEGWMDRFCWRKEWYNNMNRTILWILWGYKIDIMIWSRKMDIWMDCGIYTISFISSW